MLRVLFVEDDREAIDPILDQIEQKETEIEYTVFNFHEAEENIRSLRPDIVILDLFDGALIEENNRGSAQLDFIWEQQFCPVVVHTGLPEAIEDFEHPFVQMLKKGRGSDEQVLEAIRSFKPHVQALKEAEDYIKDSFAFAMRDVAPYAFDTFSEIEQRNDAILRASRRRLAAMMDNLAVEGKKLASWEQYICPPISKDTLLGDILKKNDLDDMCPASYRVVLTPSCDLVLSDNRELKDINVLVATCCSTKKAINLMGWEGISAGKLKGRLISTVLSRGYFETIMPLPALQGRFPTMAANLRELELIPLNDVGLKDTRFLRIASLDSPFRELVSWAYIQVSGRPGLPDRDFASWRDEIMADYQNEG